MLDRELFECAPLPSTRGPCAGGCTLNAAFATRCPSPLYTLEMAASYLLVGHARGSDLFGFHFEGGLVSAGRWNYAPLPPLLTSAGEQPIVLHADSEGNTTIDPGASIVSRDSIEAFGRVVDAGYSASQLRLLITNGSSVLMSSFGSDGSYVGDTLDYPRDARFVRGTDWLVTASDSGELALRRGGPSERLELQATAGLDALSAVAIGERVLIASPGFGEAQGTVVVWDDGSLRTFGSPRDLSCPGTFRAYYPDICEFENVPEVTTPSAVLAATLVVNEGEPWLVSIVGDTIDRCETRTGGCFETLPCDCSYLRRGRAVQNELRLENLDDDSRTLRIGLNDFPHETVGLAASGSASGAIVVAVAEGTFTPSGDHAGTIIDYLMLTP